MHWTDYLTSREQSELQDLEQQYCDAISQRRRIYDRCRQRMRREALLKEAGK
jgi:hypothetical protein